MLAARRAIWRENGFLVAATAIVVLIITFRTEYEMYVPLVFGSFATAFIIAKMLLGDSLRFGYLTVPSFFMLMYIIVMPFGSMAIFAEMQHPIKYTYFIAVQSVLLTFPIGVAMANCVIRNPSVRINEYIKSDLILIPSDLAFLRIVTPLLLSSVFVLALYYVYSEYVQLVEIIKQYPTDIDMLTLRFAGSDDLPRVIQYAFELVRRFVIPLCVLYAYFMSRAYRARWKYIFWMLWVGGVFISSLTLDRAPPVAFVFMFVLAYILASKDSVLEAMFSLRPITVVAAAIMVGGIISAVQYQSEYPIEKSVKDMGYLVFYRVLQDAPYMASVAFETFNDSTSFLYGSSMRILSPLPGYEYVESVGSTIFSPAAPVGFVADLWRNFGWPGVIVGTVFIGFVYQLIQLGLFRRKSVVTASVNVIVLVGSIWIIHGNVLGVMSTSILLFGMLFAWLYGTGRRGRVRIGVRGWTGRIGEGGSRRGQVRDITVPIEN